LAACRFRGAPFVYLVFKGHELKHRDGSGATWLGRPAGTSDEKGSRMISHIHSATILVSDQEKALDFYLNKLGWEKGLDAPMGDGSRFITVMPPGAATQLAFGAPNWFPDRKPGGATGISVVAEDIDETYKTLSARGVKFKEPPAMMPWGSRATWFYDQDDNEIFLAEG
jgi:predicted enzyme related to lactoylglutathione lyase